MDSEEEVIKIQANEIQCPPDGDPNRELATILYLCMMECSATTGTRIANWAKRSGFPIRPV